MIGTRLIYYMQIKDSAGINICMDVQIGTRKRGDGWYGGIIQPYDWYGGIIQPYDWYGGIIQPYNWYGGIIQPYDWYGGIIQPYDWHSGIIQPYDWYGGIIQPYDWYGGIIQPYNRPLTTIPNYELLQIIFYCQGARHFPCMSYSYIRLVISRNCVFDSRTISGCHFLLRMYPTAGKLNLTSRPRFSLGIQTLASAFI